MGKSPMVISSEGTEDIAGTKTDDEFMRTALKRLKLSEEYEHHNREEYVKDMKFYNGEQWDEAVKKERTEDGRPSLTINRIPQLIDQVINDIRLNRPRIKVRPQSSGASVEVAKIFDGIIRNVEAQSRAEIVYDNAAESMVIGGLGAWRVITDYAGEDTFNQTIKVEWIPNPLSVYFDPRPYDLDSQDANWCFVTEWMLRADFKEKYGKDKYGRDQFVSLPTSGRGDTAGWFDRDKIRIAEYWVRKPITKTIVLLSNGQVVAEDKAQDIIEKTKLRNTQAELMGSQQGVTEVPTIVKSRECETYEVQRWMICGAGKLKETPEVFPSTIIPIVRIEGKMIVIDGKRFIRGMVRNAKDPARMYNYWRSAEVEVVAIQPKSPWVATPAQIEGFENDYKNANKRNIAVLRYNPDPTSPGPPARQQPPQAAPGLFQGAAESLEDVKASMSMNDASLGQSGNERTGKAINANQKEGDVGNFTYSDNLCRGLRQTGRIMIDAIPKVMDTEQMLRIRLHDDTEVEVPVNQVGTDESGLPTILNDLTVGKYECIVDTGPSFSTMRQEASEGMIKFAQFFPQAGPLIQDLVARSQDWEFASEIADRLKRVVPPNVLSDNPPQAPPSSDEKIEQSKVEAAAIKVDREKIKTLRESIKLRQDEKGGDVRKIVLEMLDQLFQ